jgi:phosphatidylinositol transfer protein SFH5
MEKGVQLLDFETVDQMVQVHGMLFSLVDWLLQTCLIDYDGVGLSSRTAESKAAASEASSIFQSHYPEMLYKKYFVNVPSFMSWIFWLFKPLLSTQTIAKMSVVGKGPDAIGKELLVIIDTSELPKRYGGEAEAF